MTTTSTAPLTAEDSLLPLTAHDITHGVFTSRKKNVELLIALAECKRRYALVSYDNENVEYGGTIIATYEAADKQQVYGILAQDMTTLMRLFNYSLTLARACKHFKITDVDLDHEQVTDEMISQLQKCIRTGDDVKKLFAAITREDITGIDIFKASGSAWRYLVNQGVFEMPHTLPDTPEPFIVL